MSAVGAGSPQPVALSVSQLNAQISLAIEKAFRGEVWVRGEIQKLTRRGDSVYFDLAEPLGDGRTARLAVNLWGRRRIAVERKIAAEGLRLENGQNVQVAGLVRYLRWGSLLLEMSGIDTAFTLGDLSAARSRLLRQLQSEGLLERQRSLAVAPVPLSVGLVTSRTGAARSDFLTELAASGFAFVVADVDARMQGPDTEHTVVRALRVLEARRPDVIVLVRGGGAASDLAWFDADRIARTIAGLSVPVITGIGHETDQSVADAVAYLALKTPTACAQRIVERVRRFRDEIAGEWMRSARSATSRLTREADRLDTVASRVRRAGTSALDRSERDLSGILSRASAHDPARVLARGWSLTRRASDGALIRSAGDSPPGERLMTTVASGETIPSRVE